ncbi:MAG: ABC transporter ATP-binding protein [Kiritimatiellia bacterium]|jgi:ABC-type lipoprotein export system ATPase subunit|nr:ABC transporter ATP-binding protein [Kiritimatiellia bacterium]MDP6809572.1 ABC transporter ATP-binding protein [Kiritimatiellia bacterium]MDP7023577.1 ABC transporter ATP-binding protein [Kiritimatiellia bacterium]
MSVIELDEVTKRYPRAEGSDLVVLKGVSLRMVAGDCVAVTGPSGCGKSTLLNIAGTLDRPSSGRVLLDGEDLAAADDRSLAGIRNRRIGFVFQLHHLLPQCTALENVLIPTLPGGGDADAVTRAEHLLERVGLADRRHERPARLSGGECQRVAVVRALVNEPSLLLADEPTGSLDSDTAAELVNLLVELNRDAQMAMLVVTHSEAVAERMDRHYRLDHGRLRP